MGIGWLAELLNLLFLSVLTYALTFFPVGERERADDSNKRCPQCPRECVKNVVNWADELLIYENHRQMQ